MDRSSGKDENVVVLGSGSSAVQTVPNMQVSIQKLLSTLIHRV